MVSGVHHAATFVDAKDRRWPVSITVHEILECDRLFGVKLLELLSPESEESQRLSPVDKAEVLLFILEPELARKGVTAEDLCKALPDAKYLQAAFEALAAAILSFCQPSPAILDHLERARNTVRGIMDTSEAKADQLFGDLLEKELDALRRSTNGRCDPSPTASHGVA